MKRTILHINSFNIGSTGNIMIGISNKAVKNGYISYISFPSSRTNNKLKIENGIKIGNIMERNLHLILSYYSGLNGCFSKYGTKIFLKKIDDLNPDIIHLHNLHNCYINLKMLFDYIKKKNIKVVWTLHDCWAFTGKCPHFTVINCYKWKSGCYDCPQYMEYPSSKRDNSRKMYNLKKEWFTGVEHLSIVTPSQWLAEQVRESFLKDYPIKVINNGIDLNIFRPTKSNFRIRYNIKDKKILLGVANPWNDKKGLNIFIELAERLNNNYKIVLVGLTKKQKNNLPPKILGLEKIESKKELAEIYSEADYFINPSLEETMGLVTVEALACGTPVIVSKSTAVHEVVDKSCGQIVKDYNVDNFYKAIINAKEKKYLTRNCIQKAKNYDMNDKYQEYIDLYDNILLNNFGDKL